MYIESAKGYAGWSRSWGAEVEDSIYLLPGALYIGNQASELKTLLGSCVAVTLWHPTQKIAAMTHIVLPGSDGDLENPKFATGAIHLLTQSIKLMGFQPGDFQVGVYGGGNMFDNIKSPKVIDVGNTNVKKTIKLLVEAGFKIKKQDVLGSVYRHILLNRHTGAVQVKQTQISSTMG